MKRQLPFVLVFIFGAFMAIQYFMPHESSEWVYEFFALDWVPIIGIFALALGIWSLIRVSYDKIKHRRQDWQYSIVLLIGLFAIIISGFIVKVGEHWEIRLLNSGICLTTS
jgi:amino acid transporter